MRHDQRDARILVVTLGERAPGGPPPACHDPRLFVTPERLRSLCARHGVVLRVHGLRPAMSQYVGFLLGRRRDVEMVGTRSLATLYQGVGVKDGQARTRSSAA